MKIAALFGLGALGLAACSSGATGPTSAETGESAADAVSVVLTCTHSNMGSSTCSSIRDAITAGWPAERQDVLTRALAWVDAGVMYSQSKYHQGYRQDCSGFVSMAWQEDKSNYTGSYAPFDTGVSTELGSYEDLVPGDALNKVPREHIVMFAGWANDAHTKMYVLEESHTGTPAMIAEITQSYFSNFRPIRDNNLASVAPSPSPSPTDTTSPPSPPPSGPACSGDGDCNPGNDGSGMICVSHACTPGCHSDAQCPGVTSCVGGSCK